MKSTRSVFFLFLIFSSLWLFTACAAEPEFKGMLWKVTDPSNKKSDKDLYILGSVHNVSTQNLKLSQEIWKRFERAATVVVEGNPDQLSVDSKALFDSDLKKYVDLETEVKLVEYMLEVGYRKVQIDMALRSHPYAFFRFLTDTAKPTKRALEKYDFRKVLKYPGVDAKLLRSARDVGKAVKYLETDADVMRIWIEACSGKTENSLVISHAIDLLTGAKQEDQRALEAFLAFERGDTQRFKNWYLSKEAQQSADISILQKCSVVPRNLFWKSKIIDHLRGNDNTLVIVGAAHLLGTDSLVELLRAEGFLLELVE